MHPYRPPFGGPARPTNPNTTQPQTPYNLQDMDPSFLTYAAFLSGASPFVPPTYGFGQAGGSQPSQPEPESEPDVEVVPESQPEPVQDKKYEKNMDFRSSSFFFFFFGYFNFLFFFSVFFFGYINFLFFFSIFFQVL
ncbi:hypothetical protein HanRHA438_Chr13g0586981 [Helianthus annuus]|nr:hypothetical protein HanRHA438_Chr13g0586981 [Helianthus annuus]